MQVKSITMAFYKTREKQKPSLRPKKIKCKQECYVSEVVEV